MSFEFEHALWLWLLPLALLPLRRERADALTFSATVWLPENPAGPWVERAWRWSALLTLTCIIVGLASPGLDGGKLTRTGRGAEVLIMFDRSSSMDARPRPRVTDGSGTTAGLGLLESKNTIARSLLTQFVQKRREDRFALMTFATRPMLVSAFADHNDAVIAGLAATGVGRGLPRTDMGFALQSAISHFEARSYSGSRVILVVSDGGAELDAQTREAIRDGLTRNKISLYFIYVRSTGSVLDLNAAATDTSDAQVGEEVQLHRFFLSLETPYHLFEAEDANSMDKALREIDRQQNKPLLFHERIPRQEFSHWFYLVGLLCAAILLAIKTTSIRNWG